MFHVQTQKILVAGEDNIHIRDDGRVQDRLVFCVAYQLFGVVYRRDQLIGHLRQQHFGIREVFGRFSPENRPQFRDVAIAEDNFVIVRDV